MSAAEDKSINLEVDGKPVTARPGQMLIEVTDAGDIYVPRFCYHPKLSVAANCRMCLVDIEKAPKPMPACATPVVEGMKVFTRSERAISAQKATMEFLLINHPLDCPICDQGGECELQDLAMGFGRGVSRYTERKRVVKDKSLGPLVSTDMTRCIHCTRCVRFGQEIAGIQELGAVGRSEDMEIGTYIEKSVDHELSGNIIDLCPVGALNNKPYRYSARAWEMVAVPMISPHDCAGSNLYGHALRGTLRRVVPRDNDDINESWIADRDRYSCHAMNAPDRVLEPMIKKDKEWIEVSWQDAISAVAATLESGAIESGDALGILASPNSTIEELSLLRRIADRTGCRNVDHRLRRRDFEDEEGDPPWPWLGARIAELRKHDGIVLIGSRIRSEVPILAHHLRFAAKDHETAVAFVNPESYECRFPVAGFAEAPAGDFVSALTDVVVAAAQETNQLVPQSIARLVEAAAPDASHRSVASALLGKKKTLVLLGHLAQRHPEFSTIRLLADALCGMTGASLGYISEGANSVGGALAGLLPHREPGGDASPSTGLNAISMLRSPRRVYVLFGLEPEGDLIDPQLAKRALGSADRVICFATFASPDLLDCADIILPLAAYGETEGTFVNCEGRWQRTEAAAQPAGNSRPGWRILRVIGNALGLPNCEYQSASEIAAELEANVGGLSGHNVYSGSFQVRTSRPEVQNALVDVNIYAVDATVRRSEPLQETVLAGGG
jgi:NADH-quinone oxidoreductase subunit G